MRIAPALLLVSSALWTAPALAQTQIYCCNDAAGRMVCGDFMPKECEGRANVERDGKGNVVKRNAAPLTAEQMARAEAESAKKIEEQKKRIEEQRRNKALLDTYVSDKDIDSARDRALVDVDKLIDQAEKRLTEALAKKVKIDKDKEFYNNKALPPALKAQILEADGQVTTQQEAVAAKKRERLALITRFEDERKRFHELTNGKTIQEIGREAASNQRLRREEQIEREAIERSAETANKHKELKFSQDVDLIKDEKRRQDEEKAAREAERIRLQRNK